MSLDPDKELEMAIDRELKSLPDVAAPPSLAPSVMARLARRGQVVQGARSWSRWPLAVRLGAMSALLALAGLGWLGLDRVWQPAAERVMANYSGVSLAVSGLWKGLILFGGAVSAAVKSLGTPVLAGWFTFALLAYVVFVGLASCYVKLGLSRKEILWKR